MTITLSHAEYQELLNANQAEVDLNGDSISPIPDRLGQGYSRCIALKEDVELCIEEYCLHDDVIVKQGDRPHPLEYTVQQTCRDGINTQHYQMYGCGLAPKEQWHRAKGERIVSINVHIEPAAFQRWVGDIETLPIGLKPLIGSPEQKYHCQSGMSFSSMRTVFQQILRCPYQGVTRRLYAQSKVWEMMALILEDMSETKSSKVPTLKPDDVERIHYAGEILRSQLNNPPSLIGLARLAQINDHKLKVGFRQVFGTTVFGYLHNCRMERSRQLLESGDITVANAAQIVGFTSRSHFAVAFRKKFGINPGIYRKHKCSVV